MFKKITTKSKVYKFVYSLFLPIILRKNIKNENPSSASATRFLGSFNF